MVTKVTLLFLKSHGLCYISCHLRTKVIFKKYPLCIFYALFVNNFLTCNLQTLTTPGTVVGIDEDHDIMVLYPSSNR